MSFRKNGLTKTTAFAMLLVAFALLDGGCCTINAIGFVGNRIKTDHFAVERKGTLRYDRNVFAVEVEEEIAHRYLPWEKCTWHTRRSLRREFPLGAPPSRNDVYAIHIEQDEKAPRSQMVEYNLKRAIEHGRSVNVSPVPLLLARFSLAPSCNIEADQNARLIIHPEDFNGLSGPFYLYSHGKGKYRWREDLMIPFKREDNVIYIYSAGERRSRSLFFQSAQPAPWYDTFNPATFVGCAVLVPPALVIDIVTAPIVVPACLVFGALLSSSLGP